MSNTNPMKFPSRCLLPALATAAALVLGACGTPDQYYLLTATAPGGGHPTRDAASIGLGPVRIPDYIDRAELVFQSAPNRFEIPLGHRWTGDLEPAVTRVLATDLEAILAGPTVSPYPWTSGELPRYSVTVTIAQFHSVSGDDAILDASWTVLDGRNGASLTTRSVTLREPLAEDGYAGIVAAQSRLLAQLAAQIAPTVPSP